MVGRGHGARRPPARRATPHEGDGCPPRARADRGRRVSHRLDIRFEESSVTVTARGELDAFGAPDLRHRLDEALAGGGRLPIVLDLGAVEFLDSTALGTVVGAYRRAVERERPFTIVAPRGHARRIFGHTSLDAVLPLVDPPPADPR